MNDKLYLYGGMNSGKLVNSMATVKIEDSTIFTCHWEKIFPEYTFHVENLMGNSGSNGICYNNKIFFLFGCENFDYKPEKLNKRRDCFNEIITYNPSQNKITMDYPTHKTNRHITGRKDFAGFLLDNWYYCHGGIDTQS